MRAAASALRRAEQHRRSALAVALVLVPTFSSSALAASCSRDVVAQIRVPPGKACWAYRGSATSFIGTFSSGQTVSAQMTGEATDYDPPQRKRRDRFAAPRPECGGARRVLLWRSAGAGRSDLHRPRYRDLSLQFLALRHVGRARRGQDLRALKLLDRRAIAAAVVMPAKAGIQQGFAESLIPSYAGMTERLQFHRKSA